MDETHRRSTSTSPGSTITDLSQDDQSNYRDFYSIQNDKSHTASSVSFHPQENTVHFPDSIHPQDPPIKEKTHERITIVETPFPRTAPIPDDPPPHFCAPITNLAIFQWIYRQCTNTDNRYAFQVGIGFTIAALLVMITPASNVIPSVFWVGVSVVTVLDNTVGGFLSLSLQRLLGTIVGGASSIIVMTVTRAIFHPKWEWPACVVLGVLMFIQVFFISKLKMRPNMAYTGSIGLLTTCIILLSGYSDLIHDRLSYTAELGAWRTLNLILGIGISLFVSIFVFPLRASSVMRKNLGKALEDAADLYEKSSAYYLDFGGNTTNAINESLAFRPPESFLSRTFSTQPPGTEQQQIEEMNQFWTHDAITSISNSAFGILAKLNTESSRLRNVSNESKIQIVFHIFGGGKERCKRDLRRAKRYNDSIEAMKRVVWPLVSFRLLMPLISLSHPPAQYTLQERIKPTKETLESFKDSLTVMIRLGSILKNSARPLSEFPDDWLDIDRMVTNGNLHIQRELRQTIRVGMEGQHLDGLKLLSYYGFLVRCSMIWDGLKTVVEKLSPLNGTLSRGSSMGVITPLPNREIVFASE